MLKLVEVGVVGEGVGCAGVAAQLVHQGVVRARDGTVAVAVLFKLFEVFHHGGCSALQVVHTVLQRSFPVGVVIGVKRRLSSILPEVPGDLESPAVVATLVGATNVSIAPGGGLADATKAVLGLAVHSGSCQGDDDDRN